MGHDALICLPLLEVCQTALVFFFNQEEIGLHRKEDRIVENSLFSDDSYH